MKNQEMRGMRGERVKKREKCATPKRTTPCAFEEEETITSSGGSGNSSSKSLGYIYNWGQGALPSNVPWENKVK